MPTPQENSLFVEQASCLFIKMIRVGKMPNPYSPQENSLFVEQARKPVHKNNTPSLEKGFYCIPSCRRNACGTSTAVSKPRTFSQFVFSFHLTSPKVRSLRFASLRFAPLRFALLRFAPLRFTPPRFAPLRFALL